MKKVLLFLVALLTGVSGAMAVELTVTPAEGTYVTSSGNYVNSITFATTPVLTVTASANNMDKRQTGDYLLWHSGSAGSGSYTLSVPDGYLITSYTVTGAANSQEQTLTAGSTTHTFAVGTSSSFTVSGLAATSTSFTQTGDNASGLKITSISVTLEEANADVVYVISDANGVVYTSSAIKYYEGYVITELPDAVKRPFCSYSAINHTVVAGENTVNATVTYDMPFEVNTDKLYYATLRGHYVYYSAENNDVRTNQTTNEKTDAYKWSFYGNPYAGIKVKSYAAGKYLTNTASTVQLTDDGFAWTLARKDNTSIFGLANGANYINEQNHTNHNLIYWTNFAGDAGSQWTVEAVPAAEVEVTYNVLVDGNIVATASEIQPVGEAPVVPSTIANDFAVYTYDVAEIATNTTVVNATATFTNLPFEYSTDYATAKWYYLHGHATYDSYYVSTNGDALVWNQTLNKTSDAYMWAIMGNPYATVLVNKATGETKGMTGTNPVTMTTTPKGWTLKLQTTDNTNNSVWKNGAGEGFGLYDPTLTYVNAQSGTLKYWGSFDQGSTFWVTEVPTDFAAQVASEVKPWFDNYGGYFQLKSEIVEANKSKLEAALVSCDMATYVELTALIAQENMKYPETGYYRLKNRNYTTRYMGATGTQLLAIEDGGQSAASVVKLTKNGDKYSISLQGLSTGDIATSAVVALGTTPTEVYAVTTIPGYGSFTLEGGYKYLHSNASYKVVGWGIDAYASQWTIEEATEVVVPMNDGGDGNYYATFCAPFDATVSGAKAYTLAVSGEYLVPTEVATIAAGTPVLLKGTESSATLTIGSEYSATPVATTALTGSYLEKATAAGELFLGKSTDGVGFYGWDGTTLAANRAYVAASAGVKGYAIQFDLTDAIQAVEAQTEKAAIYNMAGQRVQKAQKGLYIVNGKKVMVK